MKLYLVSVFNEGGEGSKLHLFTNWNERVTVEFDGNVFHDQAYHLKSYWTLRNCKVKVDEIDLNEEKKSLVGWITY